MKKIAIYKDEQYTYTQINHTRKIVRCVLFNEKQEICLLKIKGEDIFGKRDYYELPGGGKNRLESYRKALKREILEEVGYEIDNIKKNGRIIDFYNLIKRKNDNHYFVAHIKGNKKETSLEEYEKNIFENIIFVGLDTAIELYKSKLNSPLGKLIGRRELKILQEVKRRQLK